MMNNLAFCGIVLLLWINIPAETDAMPNDKGRELDFSACDVCPPFTVCSLDRATGSARCSCLSGYTWDESQGECKPKPVRLPCDGLCGPKAECYRDDEGVPWCRCLPTFTGNPYADKGGCFSMRDCAPDKVNLRCASCQPTCEEITTGNLSLCEKCVSGCGCDIDRFPLSARNATCVDIQECFRWAFPGTFFQK
ncbi:unnamed protein product [Clavelina lepadiformis]|uniref:Uncharacterized protein n=2 Tax=Clavelina lepadiformis TaxID=159417 RepID=A0ABP0GGS8_CLALP